VYVEKKAAEGWNFQLNQNFKEGKFVEKQNNDKKIAFKSTNIKNIKEFVPETDKFRNYFPI
jgi:hypothetical protein